MSGGHTSGPWRWLGNWLVPAAPTADAILTYTSADDGLHGAEADKALIAAAPDLLEALEAFIDGADDGHISVEVDRAARAAISKARGEA